jgi:hypothetical protein
MAFVMERRKSACEIVSAGRSRFTGADLIGLLRSLTKPDEEYLALVEELTANQPTVAESEWQRE